MTNVKFDALFDGPPRKPDQLLTQHHMDLAASVQEVLEEVILRMTRSLAAETGSKNLCLAGGVALNCVANGKILRDGRFERIWIQPASGDAGGALGAALAAYHLFQNQPRQICGCGDRMRGSYLGPEFSETDIEQSLTKTGAKFVVLDDSELLEQCVDALVDEKALGWFQGRMEFGPRALGARSILGDAALAPHAVHPELKGEVSRVVPALRAIRAARAGGRVVRAGFRQPLYAAGGRCGGEPAQVHDALSNRSSSASKS